MPDSGWSGSLQTINEMVGSDVSLTVITEPPDGTRISMGRGTLGPPRPVRQRPERHDRLGDEWWFPIGNDAGFWLTERAVDSARWEEGDLSPNYVLRIGRTEVWLQELPS